MARSPSRSNPDGSHLGRARFAVGLDLEEVGETQEPGHERGGGIGPELLGWTFLDHLPGVHHHHPVGQRQRLGVVVGHVDHADGEAGEQLGQLEHEPLPQRPVERAEGLVEHQQRGRGRQRPGQRDALALAPGERRDRPVLEAAQTDQLQHLGDASVAGGRRVAPHLQPEGDVGGHVPMREEGVVLEHQADPPLMGGHRDQIAAVESHPPSPGRFETGHHAQQRGLAAPARSEQRDDLAVVHSQVEPVERGLVPVVDDDAFDRQHQNSPSVPTRTRSMSSTTTAVSAINTVLNASACPSSRGPGRPSSW